MPSEWNEDEHPRGQPDNKGQFVKKIFMYPAKRCDRWVILNISELPDGTRTPARVIVDNGSYISPKVKTIVTFDNDDRLYDAIDIIWREHGQGT